MPRHYDMLNYFLGTLTFRRFGDGDDFHLRLVDL